MDAVMPTPAPGAQPAEPDTAALLQAAAQAGSAITSRMLETFRAEGLIPHPHRAGYRGRAPVWRYPAGTELQLVALLRWRRSSKDPDLLKVLLWLDGFVITPSAVRTALTHQLQVMAEAMEQEISRQAGRLGLDPADRAARSQAIDAVAQTIAAKRGTTPLPRRSRVAGQDRTRAVTLMIRGFGLGETLPGTAEDAAVIERVLGLAPNGRRNTVADTGPWLTGPAEDLLDAAGIVGLPHLLAAVHDASDADLVAARQTVAVLFRHLPLMIRMFGAMFDDDNYTGLAGLRQIDQHPESLTYIVPLVIAMLRAGWKENLDAVTSALRPFLDLADQAQRLLDLPVATLTANLAGQPAEVRDRVQRIIDAAIEGQFDIEPNTSPQERLSINLALSERSPGSQSLTVSGRARTVPRHRLKLRTRPKLRRTACAQT
jgi:hypothetical protein